MSEQLWSGVIPSITTREGIDVTATITVRTGSGVEIAYRFDDPEQRDVDDLVWDCEVAAHLAERLKLVTAALHANEDLRESLARFAMAGITKDGGAEVAHKQALVAYDKAMAALPKVLP